MKSVSQTGFTWHVKDVRFHFTLVSRRITTSCRDSRVRSDLNVTSLFLTVYMSSHVDYVMSWTPWSFIFFCLHLSSLFRKAQNIIWISAFTIKRRKVEIGIISIPSLGRYRMYSVSHFLGFHFSSWKAIAWITKSVSWDSCSYKNVTFAFTLELL